MHVSCQYALIVGSALWGLIVMQEIIIMLTGMIMIRIHCFKRCVRVCMCMYARVRVKEGPMGGKGGCTIYELQLNNISEKSSDYCLTT